MTDKEEQILKLIGDGNHEGLKCLFDSYYKPLCIFAMNFLDSFEEAEDVVQDTFVNFWELFRHRRFEGSLRAYLFSSVQYACVREVKKKTRYHFEPLESVINYESYAEEDFTGEYQRLYCELSNLPEQCHKVFELIVLQEMKYKDVAETLGISVNTVKTHFARALKQLRGSLHSLVLMLIS